MYCATSFSRPMSGPESFEAALRFRFRMRTSVSRRQLSVKPRVSFRSSLMTLKIHRRLLLSYKIQQDRDNGPSEGAVPSPCQTPGGSPFIVLAQDETPAFQCLKRGQPEKGRILG